MLAGWLQQICAIFVSVGLIVLQFVASDILVEWVLYSQPCPSHCSNIYSTTRNQLLFDQPSFLLVCTHFSLHDYGATDSVFCGLLGLNFDRKDGSLSVHSKD